jgi:hypothetical protein
MTDKTRSVSASSGLCVLRACVIGAALALNGCGGGGGGGNDAGGAPPADRYAKVPTPTVAAMPYGEITPDHDYPFSAVDFDLAPHGFVQEEFLIEGKANTYDIGMAFGIGAEVPAGGDANITSADHPYKTRILVFRPSDPARFNGTVVYDWLNATSGYDITLHWFHQKDFILRKGYAYVGITAQHMPIDSETGLKQFSPERYGMLDVTDGGRIGTDSGSISFDALAFDIYAQGAKAIRAVPMVLGKLPVKKIIAVGGSQSAGRVGVFMNNVNPISDNIVDASLIIYGGPKLRTDLTTPIIKVITETETEGTGTLNQTQIAQPDTDKLKTWIVAGAAHADFHGLMPRIAIYLRDMDMNAAGARETCATPSRSRVNARYVYNAAITWIEKYLDDASTKIPTCPAVEFAASSIPTRPVAARDADGIIRGGVRLPDVDVPVGVNTGIGCGLSGTFSPFGQAKLDALYPTHGDYVAKVSAAANKAIAEGFLLPEDAQDVIDTAHASVYGRQLVCGPLCEDIGTPPYSTTSQILRRHAASYYVRDRALLLAPLDDATIQIATGYTRTAPAEQDLYFGQAISSLATYVDLVLGQRETGALSKDAANYLVGEASQLITDLQRLMSSN